MKLVRAVTKYVRISPSKARLAANMIRGKNATDAMTQLNHSPLKGSKLLKKTLMSAIANAEVKLEARKESLSIYEVKVDEGPTLKRFKSKCRGGRVPIMKRMSHFTIILLMN